MDAQQHQTYQKWLKELDFYQEEMNLFEKELNMLVEKHPELLSIIEHVEEYQRIFHKKKRRIQLLQTQIGAKDRVSSTGFAKEETPNWDYDRIQKEQKEFVNKMESLRKNFRRFVAKNMH